MIAARLSELLVRVALGLVARGLFRIRIVGRENIPSRGPALLVANHVTFLDGFIIGFCVRRVVRFMVWRPCFRLTLMKWGLGLARAIPVGTLPLDLAGSIRRARRELEEGHVVCIFAEGSITRTGNLLPFKRGLETIVQGLDVRIIPVHLDGLWGSVFSFERGKFFWKLPRRMRHPVTVSFGAAMPASSAASEVRQAIQQLGADAVALRKTEDDTLSLRFLRVARKNWRRLAFADASGHELTFGQALTASLAIADWIRKHCAESKMIGVLLPQSAHGALANIGATIAGKVPVNLNFTTGPEAIASTIEQCNISTVLTSNTFVTETNIEVPAGVVFLEDILTGTGGAGRAFRLGHRFLPARVVLKRYSAVQITPDAVATVNFSNGRSVPAKAVMLSHYNIVSNVDAMAQLFWIGKRDRLMGVLPFFHSFGLTVTMWFPLLTGCAIVYHASPAHAAAVGSLISKYKCTFLLSTPAFCARYARKSTRLESTSLRYVVVGAGKLHGVATALFEKFDLKVLEGYGCPEMAPVIAANAPDFVSAGETQVGSKAGTVGHPLPGIAVRVIDPESMQALPVNRKGLVLVKGPNRMIGYIGQPEQTSRVMLDGWYITGDIGVIDEDGFLRIAGRAPTRNPAACIGSSTGLSGDNSCA